MSWVLGLIALLALVPATTLFVECVFGLLHERRLANSEGARAAVSGERPRVAVLVPAHDEQDIIVEAVNSLKPQLAETDRLIVIADNCTDATAQRAREAGADVTQRQDADNRGKGWALDHGVTYLKTDPPEVVLFMDADCVAGPGLVDVLARRSQAENTPVQADYRLLAPANNPDAGRGARFAWRLKDRIRPLGTAFFNMPCQLAGSGMAIPWDIACSAPLAGSDLVEDLKLGLDLAQRGHAPVFEPSVNVDSELPPAQMAQDSQKERWVQGHLLTIARRALPMLVSSIRRRDPRIAVMALDLAVPPFGLLMLTCLAGIVLSGLLALFTGSGTALSLFLLAFVLAVGGVLLVWFFQGRDLLSFQDLAGFGLSLLQKIPLYAGVLLKRQTSWVRTERTVDDDKADS